MSGAVTTPASLWDKLAQLRHYPENCWATFFWLYFCLDVPYKIFRYGLYDALWYCDFLMLIASFCFLLKKPWLYSALLVQCSVLQFTWLTDATLFSLFSIPFSSETNYLFTGDLPFFDLILTLRHFFVIPALLYALSLREFHFRVFPAQLFHIGIYALVQGAALLLTEIEQNVSCAFQPCWDNLFSLQVAEFDSVLAYQVVFFSALQGTLFVLGCLAFLFRKKITQHSLKIAMSVVSVGFLISAIAVCLRWGVA